MRNILFGILFLCLSCGSVSTAAAQAPSAPVWTVGSPLCGTLKGIGVELDPHFLTQNVAAGIGAQQSDFQRIVVTRLSEMNVKRLRVMVLPEWYEPQNDNDNPFLTDLSRFRFQSAEMNELCRLLSVAQQRCMSVTLCFWGVRPQTFMLPESHDGWMFGPALADEWAENVSACLSYLLREKKFKCIREVTPVNEPDWSFPLGTTPRVTRYISMCRTLNRRLKSDGLRKKVLLNLSDNSDGGTGTHQFLDSCTARLANEADLFNSHTYLFGYDTDNDSILSWERHNVMLAQRANKPHFVGEFGSNQTVGSTRQRDIDRFERGVLMARIVLNLLNAGACGASYWSLFDQYYSKDEALRHNNMQQLGLWRFLRNEYHGEGGILIPRHDYEVRPAYYALSLLTRFVQPGAQVFPLHTALPFTAATALRSPKGEWTYFVANQSDRHLNVRLANAKQSVRNFSQYVYQENSLPADGSQLKPCSKLQSPAGGIMLSVRPHSVSVWVEQPRR